MLKDVKTSIIVKFGLVAVFIIGLGMWGIPNFYVYTATLSGKAELRRAEQNRQIKVEEARAVSESAKMLADAEVKRAVGVAEANKIIGESLKGNEAYLRYLWITGLQDTKSGHTTVYVPTEAGLPIKEYEQAKAQYHCATGE